MAFKMYEFEGRRCIDMMPLSGRDRVSILFEDGGAKWVDRKDLTEIQDTDIDQEINSKVSEGFCTVLVNNEIIIKLLPDTIKVRNISYSEMDTNNGNRNEIKDTILALLYLLDRCDRL